MEERSIAVSNGGAARAVALPGAGTGVSVLIPARNEAVSLPIALRAIAAQDYDGPMEVIVADASSGPETRHAARAALPTVRVVDNPGRSTAAGMNRALDAARYPIVVRCDARCALPKDYVRLGVAILHRTGAANVGGRLTVSGRSTFERATALAMCMRLGSGGARYRVGGKAGPVDTVPLGIFRRDALEAVGGYEEDLARNEDYELNWRLRQRGGTVWFDPALFIVYRPRRSARALARQYLDYGRWKREVLRRHPRSLRLRHLAAPALVVGLGGSAAALAAATFSGPGYPAAVLGFAGLAPVGWLAALTAGAAVQWVRLRSVAALLTPLPMAVMHLAWGVGFLLGRRRHKPASREPACLDRNREATSNGTGHRPRRR